MALSAWAIPPTTTNSVAAAQNGSDNDTWTMTVPRCCSAGTFEVLFCIAKHGCESSPHPDDGSAGRIREKVQETCGVGAADFEERGSVELDLVLEAEVG